MLVAIASDAAFDAIAVHGRLDSWPTDVDTAQSGSDARWGSAAVGDHGVAVGYRNLGLFVSDFLSPLRVVLCSAANSVS